MVRTRKTVFENGNDWSDTLHWYAIGVREVRKRAFADRTSWRFLAAIHGWHKGLWELLGYLDGTDPAPAAQDESDFFSMCQHSSWYFLPWHRGYLCAFERIIGAAIVDAAGPRDWALPYWNYSDGNNPDARTIPAVFLQETMPDGSPNALYTPYRFGNEQTGALTVPKSGVSLEALKEPKFGSEHMIAGGFGGGRWPVAHSGRAAGMLEGTPHGDVHVAIGGSGEKDGQRIPGLMGSFVTAGLDPIFWLHHCNIDRLWEVWRRREAAHSNPTHSAWLGGPADRPFMVPNPDGSSWHFACSDVVDTTADPLEYIYDDSDDPFADAEGLVESRAVTGMAKAGDVNWEERDTELISANDEAVPLGTEGATAQVPVPGELLRGAASKMLAETVAPTEVERYFLLLDDIRGADNMAIYEVYVDYGEPGQELPSGLPRETLIGTLNTFGIEVEADSKNGAEEGLSRLYNITPVVQQMGFDEEPDLDRLHIRMVPVTQNRDVPAPTIGRIAIYREGG